MPGARPRDQRRVDPGAQRHRHPLLRRGRASARRELAPRRRGRRSPTPASSAGEVDYLVCATMTPDHYFPGSGTLIQQQLGMPAAAGPRHPPAVRRLRLRPADGRRADRSGVARTRAAGRRRRPHLADAVLASAPGTCSTATERAADRRRSCELELPLPPPPGAVRRRRRSDGLPAPRGGRRSAASWARGSTATAATRRSSTCPGVGSRRRPYVTREMLDARRSVPVMDGRAVFKLAVTRMPEVTREVLASSGYGIDDLDLLIMHQANLRINEAARKAPRPARGEGLQQHPALRQHHLGDAAAGLPRGPRRRARRRRARWSPSPPSAPACTGARC